MGGDPEGGAVEVDPAAVSASCIKRTGSEQKPGMCMREARMCEHASHQFSRLFRLLFFQPSWQSCCFGRVQNHLQEFEHHLGIEAGTLSFQSLDAQLPAALEPAG